MKKLNLILTFTLLAFGSIVNADISGLQGNGSKLGMDPLKEHGALSFSARDFIYAETPNLFKEKIQATKKAWTGWWFPSRDPEMFDMGNDYAPLEIYDEVLKKVMRHNKWKGKKARTWPYQLYKLHRKWSVDEASKYIDVLDNFEKQFGIKNSSEFEKRFIYSYNESNWDGLCEGVAFASILEEEPTKCREFKTDSGEKIIITPFHQKALLAKKYDFIDTGINYYGNKFIYRPWKTNVSGPVDDYSDIRPAQLHRLLHHYMRDRGQNLVIDYDASFPVWNVTLNGYDSFIYDEGNGVLTVKTNLYYSDPLDRDKLIGHPGNYVLDFKGANEGIIELYYELDYIVQNGRYNIISSRWTEGPGVQSFINHPDYVIALEPAKVVPRSAGDVIEPKIVDFIVNDLKTVPCPGE